ncbi:hypothetical protein, partial [Phocaeicola vulgatus]|uniref:hypothetical protein n=1 Tax=Phocaeicola vulgatus TaxID=821 RepID=UPI001C390A9B
SFCRFLITTDKALDGYTHIVIDHHGGDTMYIPEKVTVGFHEGMEKPLNFDPFGHARFAHLFVLYD